MIYPVLLVTAFLLASPFLLVSMFKKVTQDKKPTLEAWTLSIGIAFAYNLMLFFSMAEWTTRAYSLDAESIVLGNTNHAYETYGAIQYRFVDAASLRLDLLEILAPDLASGTPFGEETT